MGTPLRLLIAEDSKSDANLVVQELRDSNYDVEFERVDTPQAFRAAIAEQKWDIIISDYLMPHFSGLDALAILKKSGLDLPFIIVSGVIGEDIAVSAIKAGASDYVMKDNLARLDTAVRRALKEAEERRARQQAEEALKLKLTQLAALSQASQMVTASLELDQVLANIVSLASEVVGADYTGVILVDETGQIGQSIENLPGMPSLEYRIREKGLTHWIVNTRQAVFIDNIGDDGAISIHLGEDAPRVVNPFLVKAGVRSLAGLPLMVKERLLGVLYLHSVHPQAFRGQMYLLVAFSNQVAIAIENARLFQAEQNQTRRRALLAEIANIAATTLDIDKLLQAASESIHRYYNHPLVEIFTVDEEGKSLVLRSCSDSALGIPEMAIPGVYHQPIEQGILGLVARTGKPYRTDDVTSDPYFFNPAAAPTQSALCVPILDEGRAVGAILVESDKRADFDQDDQSLLEAIADTVAIGMRNARLYHETRRHVQELTFLNRISVGFGLAPDLDTLIARTLEELHLLMHTDRTYFITADPENRLWKTTHEKAHPAVCSILHEEKKWEDTPVEAEAILSGQPFAVADIEADPRVEKTREMYRARGTRSSLLVPIQISDRLYGALGFDHCHRKHAWRADEIRLLEGVAHQLGLGLENVRLFEEARLRADELADALARLEELDRHKDEFIQNVSHELRSPLALIRGYAEMLDSNELGELTEEQKKAVGVIARRSRMLSDLVQDITLILEAEVNPPKPEPVPLDELARMAIEDFQVAVEEAGLTLRSEIPDGLPPVCGSPTYLRRVLDNLIGNAVKFTPAGGSITVRLRDTGDQLALEVSDTGVGIPANQLERIFERFYQVDGSARRRYGGVGLGLALVKDIVQTYGGRVAVESEVGKGSTFTVLLPIARDAKF